jgi:hypothetical protein
VVSVVVGVVKLEAAPVPGSEIGPGTAVPEDAAGAGALAVSVVSCASSGASEAHTTPSAIHRVGIMSVRGAVPSKVGAAGAKGPSD